MTSVLIVDDQPLQRMGFRMVLETEPGVSVAGEAENGIEAVRRAAELSPDVVLMDIRMPGMDGIEATRRITASGGRSRVLVLTTFDLDEYVYAALQAGASGFLLKDARPDELLAGIRAVAVGDAVVAPALTRRLLQAFAKAMPRPGTGTGTGVGTGPGTGTSADRRAAEDPRLSTLTERELEVLRVVAAGLTNAEIAEKLYLSESTVKTHVSRAMAKIGARDRVQAVIIAYDVGLVDPRG